MKAVIIKQEERFILHFSDGRQKELDQQELVRFLKHFEQEHYSDEEGNDLSCSDAQVVAYVNEDKHLVVKTGAFLREMLFEQIPYLTPEEYARKHGKKRAIVLRMCQNHRIPGVIKKGVRWFIPEDAPYPKDARVGARVSTKNE